MNDDDIDIALELTSVQHAAMLRSKGLLEACWQCGALPRIESKDMYGYARVVSMLHDSGCAFD